MKRSLNVKRACAGIFVLILLLFSCNDGQDHTGHQDSAEYTCPMHPKVLSDKPGSCPVCGMDLVPLKLQSGETTSGASNSLEIIKSSAGRILSNIKTVRPYDGVVSDDLQLQGRISYDTNNWNTIAARVPGRIERLYIRYTNQYVKKGEKLLEIYSPDLANAQQEMLYLSRSGDIALLNSAKQKLRLLGATEQQINTVLRTGKINYSFAIYSPHSGYVAEQPQSSAPSGTQRAGTSITNEGAAGSMGGMGASGTESIRPLVQEISNAPLLIREGQYLTQGQKIFSMVKASSLWAEFYARSTQLADLKRGTSVQLTAIENSSQKAFSKISLIQPYYQPSANFSLVKARVDNKDGNWRPGQLISVKTALNPTSGRWVPRTAVLTLGTDYVVFVKKGASFSPVRIKYEGRLREWVDIGDSLDKNTEIAANAWFMVDSESFVNADSLGYQQNNIKSEN